MNGTVDATTRGMARTLLLVASGFVLALVVVVAALFVGLRSLSGPPDTARVAHNATDVGHERTPADPDEAPAPDTASRSDDAALSGDARLTMQNVALVAAPGVTIDVVRMKGLLRSTDDKGRGNGVDLEKPDTFDVVVDDAEVRVREDILQKLAWRIDREVPGLAGARVVLNRVLVRKGRVVQEGTLALGPLNVPFTVTGTLAATKSGDVRVEVISAHVGGVDTKRIIDALDVDLRELLNRGDKGAPKGVRGGESLSLVVSPAAMETKPRMVGKVRSVRIEDDVVVVLLGDKPENAALARPAKSEGNSLVIAGGYLVLGKMTMKGAIAELVDTDDDALMIDMKHFQKQLYASVCRATPQGVRIHMVDANDVRHRGDASRKPVGR